MTAHLFFLYNLSTSHCFTLSKIEKVKHNDSTELLTANKTQHGLQALIRIGAKIISITLA